MAEINLLDTHFKTVRDYNKRVLEQSPEIIGLVADMAGINMTADGSL